MKKFSFIFLLLFFSGCSFLPQEPINTLPIPENFNNSNTKNIDEILNIEQKQFLENEQEISNKTLTYKISHIIDGDTLYVIMNGKEKKIRILGIDTPEKNGGFRTAECFGNDASEYAKKYLQGKRVSLLESKIGNSEDKYGRLLRYVFVDGEDFGAHLIAEGYAESYKRFPHERKKYYNSIEKKSQNLKKGMWNEENCEYWEQER